MSDNNVDQPEKLSRRSFFRLIGGGIAAAVVAPKILAEKILEIPVEYGFTWYVDEKYLPDSTLNEIVTKTLRENAKLLADNVSQNNALLLKLKDGVKAQLKVEKINPKDQEQRIIKRIKSKQDQKNGVKKVNQCDKIPIDTETQTFYPGYFDIEGYHLNKISEARSKVRKS